jgi:hypothetical protein
MSQTSYPTTITAAIAGLLAGSLYNAEIASAKNDSGGAIPFGIGLKTGPNKGDAVVPPSGAGDKLRGISMFEQGLNNIGLASASPATAGILDQVEFNLVERGRVWVIAEEAVDVDSPVYCRYAAGAGGTQLGAFRASADTATAALVKGARYLSKTTGVNQLALLEFDTLVANS